MRIQSISNNPDKTIIDSKEQSLLRQGYRQAYSRLQNHPEYLRHENNRDKYGNHCQPMYSIEWTISDD